MTKTGTVFAVLINTGTGYGPKVGWDEPFRSRVDAEQCAARAADNEGWAVKVVEMTLDEAVANGWI